MSGVVPPLDLEALVLAPLRKAKALGPPSIPAPDQSFGYEEATDGALRMQRPPPGGYTGVSGHRSAGGSFTARRCTEVDDRAGS